MKYSKVFDIPPPLPGLLYPAIKGLVSATILVYEFMQLRLQIRWINYNKIGLYLTNMMHTLILYVPLFLQKAIV